MPKLNNPRCGVTASAANASTALASASKTARGVLLSRKPSSPFSPASRARKTTARSFTSTSLQILRKFGFPAKSPRPFRGTLHHSNCSGTGNTNSYGLVPLAPLLEDRCQISGSCFGPSCLCFSTGCARSGLGLKAQRQAVAGFRRREASRAGQQPRCRDRNEIMARIIGQIVVD
jgi:hypothetical protein